MNKIANKQITNNDLYDFLVDRFDKIDGKFTEVDNQFSQVDDRFDQIDGRLDNLENTQDYILGELRDLNEEKTVSAYRSVRIESWVIKAAKKLDLPYER